MTRSMIRSVILLTMTAALAAAQATVGGGFDLLSSGQQYILGPGDQIVIRASGAEDISEKPIRIENDGSIRFPLLGQAHPGGQTIEAFERSLTEGLRAYIRDPQVIVSVTQLRSQPVTLAGSFRTPGVYNLTGRHTMTEMMSIAGGLMPNAKRTLQIRRQMEQGSTGLKDERVEADGKVYIAWIDLAAGAGETSLGDDFVLKPFDLVTAVADDPIIVSGEVAKVGPIFLGDLKTLSLVQAISMSGGLTREASKHIRIYRTVPDSPQKVEIQVDLEQLFKGAQTDPMLTSRDIVFVPHATGKALAIKIAALAGGMAVSIFAGLAVVR